MGKPGLDGCMVDAMMNIDLHPHPALRWFCTLAWTTLVLVTLLQSSSQPVIGPAAPPGEPPLEREILLTVGHVVAFAGLTLLWWWGLSAHTTSPSALLMAVLIALLIGIFSELAQANVPDRAASWFDLLVNCITIGTTAWWIRWRFF